MTENRYTLFLTKILQNSFFQETKLPGDILLITAFASYMGCFTKMYRQDLMYNMWLPFYMKLEVIDTFFD